MELLKIQILGPHLISTDFESLKLALKFCFGVVFLFSFFLFFFNVAVKITTEVTVFVNVMTRDSGFVDRLAGV